MINYYNTGQKGLQKITEWESGAWINIELPTTQDIQYLLEELKIPQGFFNDIEDVDERPRVETEDGWFFVVLRLPYKNFSDESLPYYTVPLGIIFKDDIFVTVCFFKTEMINDFIKYTVQKSIEIKNSYELLMRLFISSSVWFSKYLKQIGRRIDSIEDILEKSIRNKQLQSLFSIEKSLIYFTTTLTDHTFLLKRLKAYTKLRENLDPELIEDVEIELSQAQITNRIYYDILRRMEDSYDSIISNNLNNVMKHLTSISIILMIPTLIASFYGMNVENHLEHNPLAFLWLIIASFLMSIIGFVFFKKIDWF